MSAADTAPPATYRDKTNPIPGSEYVEEAELLALGEAGYGGRMGLGSRVALLIVDVTWDFCGDDDPNADLVTAVRKYPHACGKAAWEAMPAIRSLVDSARKWRNPVIFTRKSQQPTVQSNRWQDKNRRQDDIPENGNDIVPDCGYLPGDLCVPKEAPSAFNGTNLLRHLVGMGVDSLIVAGTTTSGCVRATVVDAFSYNFKVAVASDATFDRISASHRMSLFDMNLKYADVLPVEVLTERLNERGAAAAVKEVSPRVG